MATTHLKITDTEDKFTLPLIHEMRFVSTGHVHGAPVPGIKAGDRGLLPEPYHTAALDAVYAVHHYETPILWKASDGKWYVPMHVYSGTTSSHRNRMLRALSAGNAEIVEI